MTELPYLYDPIGHEEAVAEEDARVAAANAHSKRALREAEEAGARAAHLEEMQRLAQDGLERVAKKNNMVDTESNLGMISLRHSVGHNRSLPI